MANLLDYLTWRGDLTFEERPLNEADGLIFCELSYIDMAGFVPGPESGGTVSLAELADAYAKVDRKQDDLFFNDPVPLLCAAGKSPRFRDLRLGRYINHIDPELQVQFSAVCFLMPGEKVFVAYRGTDNSVVGWREDFNFSFSEETGGQREAVLYLEEAAAALPGGLYIGGHSKGGNLAVYAAAFCDPALRSRMLRIFSMDGPGFLEKITGSDEYQTLLPRLEFFIPEASVVGILLDHQGERVILKSSASGIMQHDPMTWQVLGTAFDRVDSQSAGSAIMDKTLHLWLSELPPEQRQTFVTSLFDTMDQSGARTLTDLTHNRRDTYSAILRTLFEMDPERRGEIFSALKKLSFATHDVIFTEAKTFLTQRLEQAAARLRRQKGEADVPSDAKA